MLAGRCTHKDRCLPTPVVSPFQDRRDPQGIVVDEGLRWGCWGWSSQPQRMEDPQTAVHLALLAEEKGGDVARAGSGR